MCRRSPAVSHRLAIRRARPHFLVDVGAREDVRPRQLSIRTDPSRRSGRSIQRLEVGRLAAFSVQLAANRHSSSRNQRQSRHASSDGFRLRVPVRQLPARKNMPMAWARLGSNDRQVETSTPFPQAAARDFRDRADNGLDRREMGRAASGKPDQFRHVLVNLECPCSGGGRLRVISVSASLLRFGMVARKAKRWMLTAGWRSRASAMARSSTVWPSGECRGDGVMQAMENIVMEFVARQPASVKEAGDAGEPVRRARRVPAGAAVRRRPRAYCSHSLARGLPPAERPISPAPRRSLRHVSPSGTASPGAVFVARVGCHPRRLAAVQKGGQSEVAAHRTTALQAGPSGTQLVGRNSWTLRGTRSPIQADPRWCRYRNRVWRAIIESRTVTRGHEGSRRCGRRWPQRRPWRVLMARTPRSIFAHTGARARADGGALPDSRQASGPCGSGPLPSIGSPKAWRHCPTRRSTGADHRIAFDDNGFAAKMPADPASRRPGPRARPSSAKPTISQATHDGSRRSTRSQQAPIGEARLRCRRSRPACTEDGGDDQTRVPAQTLQFAHGMARYRRKVVLAPAVTTLRWLL